LVRRTTIVHAIGFQPQRTGKHTASRSPAAYLIADEGFEKLAHSLLK